MVAARRDSAWMYPSGIIVKVRFALKGKMHRDKITQRRRSALRFAEKSKLACGTCDGKARDNTETQSALRFAEKNGRALQRLLV